MRIYLVKGERTVVQQVLYFVKADSAFDASRKCRVGQTMKEFLVSQKEIHLPTNFEHLGIVDEEEPKSEI